MWCAYSLLRFTLLIFFLIYLAGYRLVANSTTPASRRTKWGTVFGNIKLLVTVATIVAAPALLQVVLKAFFHEQLWLQATGGFLYSASLVLAVIFLYYLFVWPFFANGHVWGVFQEEVGGDTVSYERRATRFLQPWCYAVEEGRAKVRVDSSNGILDAVMRLADKDFAMDLNPASQFANKWTDRYEVVSNTGSSPQAIPVYTAWHRYFQMASSNLQFGGLYPYKQLYTYKLTIVKADVADKSGTIAITVKPDSLTDHVRVRPFEWAVIATIYTRDRFKVVLVFTFRLESMNVDKTFFGQDRWERYFAQQVMNRAIQAGKNIRVFDLLGGAKNEAEFTHSYLADKISELNDDFESEIGIRIVRAQMPGYLEIASSDDERKALTAVPVAEQQARVTVISGRAEGTAEADIVRKRGHAAAASDAAREVSLHQALETVAAKGGTIFANLGTGGSHDPVSQAILQELRTQRGG